MNIVVTGADGFIARNLRMRLSELGHAAVTGLTRNSSIAQVELALAQADVVFHLAGVNRPKDPTEFAQGNAQLTQAVCRALAASGRRARLVLASSTQAVMDNPYGQSKRSAEDAVRAYGVETGASVHVFRLTNVFGKWAKPNYNSAVATFCHNLARDLPIQVNDPTAPLALVYIDDVVEAFTGLLDGVSTVGDDGFDQALPVYRTTVGEVVETLESFGRARDTLVLPRVGVGLTRALYSTYVSYLSPASFTYQVPRHGDARGAFVEMLKTPDCGQFSYFTAHPGVTRGEHYHHSKTEKFLVIKGTAHFGFRHIVTNDVHELVTHGGEATIVETIPGWTHNITNIGDEELIVMLWANEIFDRQKPDTIAMKVKP